MILCIIRNIDLQEPIWHIPLSEHLLITSDKQVYSESSFAPLNLIDFNIDAHGLYYEALESSSALHFNILEAEYNEKPFNKENV